MDPIQARHVLGVAADADWDAVRLRYRERIRCVHPDLTGGSPREAAEVNLAFATLLRQRRSATPPTTAPAAAAPRPPTQPSRPEWRLSDDVSIIGGETIVVDASPADALRRVMAGLDKIGEITYLDRSVPVVESVVVLDDGTSHSLLLSFRPRGTRTEVQATLEALETVATSRPDQVLRTLARFIPSD